MQVGWTAHCSRLISNDDVTRWRPYTAVGDHGSQEAVKSAPW